MLPIGSVGIIEALSTRRDAARTRLPGAPFRPFPEYQRDGPLRQITRHRKDADCAGDSVSAESVGTSGRCQRRKPPRNAARLLPMRVPGGSAFRSRRVATAEDHVVGGEGDGEVARPPRRAPSATRRLPTRFSPLRPSMAPRVLPVLARELAELERDDHVLRDQRRADAGAEAEEEHPAAFVAAERLHRGVVDDAHRAIECGREIEADPPRTEVARLGPRPLRAGESGIADRDRLVTPVLARVRAPP